MSFLICHLSLVLERRAPSHSHRGFSPVTRGCSSYRNRFNGFRLVTLSFQRRNKNERAMKNSFLIATVMMSLLACSVVAQKKYQRPPIKTPDEFRGAEPTSPVGASSIGDLKWFEVFQDEALQKLVRTAMDQNYDLRLAVARINAARANVGLARSNQFPQFDVGADLTTTRTSSNSGANIPGPAKLGLSFPKSHNRSLLPVDLSRMSILKRHNASTRSRFTNRPSRRHLATSPTLWSSIDVSEKFAFSRNCWSVPCGMPRGWPI
jgi:hypothetical protein